MLEDPAPASATPSPARGSACENRPCWAYLVPVIWALGTLCLPYGLTFRGETTDKYTDGPRRLSGRGKCHEGRRALGQQCHLRTAGESVSEELTTEQRPGQGRTSLADRRGEEGQAERTEGPKPQAHVSRQEGSSRGWGVEPSGRGESEGGEGLQDPAHSGLYAPHPTLRDSNKLRGAPEAPRAQSQAEGGPGSLTLPLTPASSASGHAGRAVSGARQGHQDCPGRRGQRPVRGVAFPETKSRQRRTRVTLQPGWAGDGVAARNRQLLGLVPAEMEQEVLPSWGHTRALAFP